MEAWQLVFLMNQSSNWENSHQSIASPLLQVLDTSLLDSHTRLHTHLFTVTGVWFRRITHISTGKTCQHGSHWIQEIPAKKLWSRNLRGLRMWQNRVQRAHPAAEISDHHRDPGSAWEHLDGGRRQGGFSLFLLVVCFCSLTHDAEGKARPSELILSNLRCSQQNWRMYCGFRGRSRS